MKDNQERLIFEYLERVRSASVDEISAATFCSPSTVRRRLNDLQEKGLVYRTHGGATVNENGAGFSDFSYRIDLNAVGKKQIALEAIKLINEGDTIFMDSSSSAYYMIKYLTEFKNIQVVTSGVDTLLLLGKNHITSYSTGGRIDDRIRSKLVGPYAEKFVEDMHFNVMFFSCKYVDTNGDLTEPNPDGNELLRKVIKNSSKSVLLCDSDKFGMRTTFKICNVSNIDYIISDKNPRDFLSVEKMPAILGNFDKNL